MIQFQLVFRLIQRGPMQQQNCYCQAHSSICRTSWLNAPNSHTNNFLQKQPSFPLVLILQHGLWSILQNPSIAFLCITANSVDIKGQYARFFVIFRKHIENPGSKRSSSTPCNAKEIILYYYWVCKKTSYNSFLTVLITEYQ